MGLGLGLGLWLDLVFK